MFPYFLPSDVRNLTEATSISLARQIKSYPLVTPITSQPIQTTYVTIGEGETPILLLHGFDSSLLEFRRLLPILGQQRKTWAIDLLGFGFTQRVEKLQFSPENIKLHLHSFWETFIKKPVILVGASMGGAAALDFTLSYPGVVEKLVLIDSVGMAKPPAIGKFMIPPVGFLATSFLSNLKVRQSISKNAYCDPSFANEDALACAALHLQSPDWSKALITFTKSGGYGSFTNKLSEIKQPTLIIWGREDKILGIKDAERFVSAISQSKLVWIDKCGHVPHLEKPKETAQAILEFI